MICSNVSNDPTLQTLPPFLLFTFYKLPASLKHFPVHNKAPHHG